MKHSTYILFLLLFIISCTSNTIYKKPKNLIPEKEMVDLMVDMEIAVTAKIIKNKHKKKNINYMPLVHEKYGIDSTRFVESNLYYASDIDNYSKILKEVQVRLLSMKIKYDELLVIQDSLSGNKKTTKSKPKFTKITPSIE